MRPSHVTPSRADGIRGALLGHACGDALGAPVEFESPQYVRRRYGTLRDMVGGGGFNWAPGEWTDDTGMMLAVAEGILELPSDPVAAVGRRFLEWRETAKDVGSTIAAALGGFRGDWMAASSGTSQARQGKAGGNGSLMRTLPVALCYSDIGTMATQSARISAMTHWDAQAEVCCLVYNLWIRELIAHGTTGDRADLWHRAVTDAERLAELGRLAADSHGPSPLPAAFWTRVREMPSVAPSHWQPTGYAGFVVDCLEAAVAAVAQSDSLESALVQIVNTAGESDTIAAVAGGAAGACWGVQAIPRRWLEVLHHRDRTEQIAERVIALSDGDHP
jgi:ADP-ribosyl-[dinitrogen reductase] hydrolase